MKTEASLFEKLKQDIEALQLQERIKKEPIEAAFEQYLQPFEHAFDATTKAQQDKARALLEPEKKVMDDKVFDITRAARKKIDNIVKKYAAFQKGVEREFYIDEVVVEALRVKDEAIAEEKSKVEAELNAISAETDAAIAALQASYDDACAKLELVEPGTADDWADTTE